LGTGLRRIAFPPSSIRYVASCGERYFVSLNGSFQDYLGKFGAKARYNLKRTVRKFLELPDGEIRFLEMFSPAGMRDFCGLAFQISRNTWQERIGGPGFPRSEEFGATMARLAAEGLARATVLFHGDRPVAYALCRAHSDCLLFARTAYDEAYAAWSPGRVLLFHLLKNLFEEKKYSCFDFGEGSLTYKQFFATDHIPCARIVYFRRNTCNLAVVLSHWSLSHLSRFAGKALQVLGVKSRLKYLLLGKARQPLQWVSPEESRCPEGSRGPVS
jgi:CelD/BcsL family acetyltransferase involved in cellulose biosynthesis